MQKARAAQWFSLQWLQPEYLARLESWQNQPRQSGQGQSLHPRLTPKQTLQSPSADPNAALAKPV